MKQQTSNNTNKLMKDTPHWISPDYAQSRSVVLDADILRKNRYVAADPDSPEMELFKVLRTQIMKYMKEKNWRTLMVTSVNPGEGKTLTAINLSFTFAKEFSQTVLLVDGDLRQQHIHKNFGISSELGLCDYLLGDYDLKDLIIWPEIEKLTLISGGKLTRDSAEVLGSPKMAMLVKEMKERYNDRYIIFDVPPILGGADAMTFAPLVDGILIVVKAGNTNGDDLQEALKLMPEEKMIGFVLNCFDTIK